MYRYYLIAGTTAIGKSNLSSKLLSLGMAVSDLDLVRDIVSGVQPDNKILSKSFFEVSLDEYLSQCEAMKHAINGMINGIVKNKQHVVILGAHMIPGNENPQSTKEWRKILMIMSDEQLHWQQFCMRAKTDKRAITKDPTQLEKHFKKTREYQEFLLSKAKTHGWHIVDNNGDALDCVAKLLAL